MPTQCEIRFDNEPDRVYYGGQSLSGRVTLSLTKEKTVRGTSLLPPKTHIHIRTETKHEKQKNKSLRLGHVLLCCDICGNQCVTWHAFQCSSVVCKTKKREWRVEFCFCRRRRRSGVVVAVAGKRLCMHDRFDAPGHPSIGCYCNKIILSDRKVLIENFATDFWRMFCSLFQTLYLPLPLSVSFFLFFGAGGRSVVRLVGLLTIDGDDDDDDK